MLRSGLIILLAAGGISTASSAAAPDAGDQVQMHAQLETLRPLVVAVLPVAAVVENSLAESHFAARWETVFRRSGHVWRSSQETRRRVSAGAAAPESLWQAVRRQILETGHPDPETARLLAEVTRSDALLSVRLDRWEITSPEAVVIEAQATLVDSAGRELWLISGAEHDRVRVVGARVQAAVEGKVSKVEFSKYSQGGDRTPVEYTPGQPGSPGGGLVLLPATRSQTDHDFGGATTRLLERWRDTFPKTPRR